jgi:hypothetical protein
LSHTASLTYSVGAPWEIIRYVHKDTGRITDVYTKLGDSGAYGGYIILIPEYNAGFSILGANVNETQRGNAANTVMDMIFEQMMPALEAQAARDAEKKFAGHYECTSGLNSSLTVTLNETAGLTISSWISNGTDMLQTFLPGKTARLFPSIPDQGDGKVAFRESSQIQTSTYVAAGVGPFTGDYVTNLDWLSVDSFHYGNMAYDLFVFEVDKDGVATTANPAITRATLQRKTAS